MVYLDASKPRFDSVLGSLDYIPPHTDFLDMGIKKNLNPRNGMIVSGLFFLLFLGLGPMWGGTSGEAEMFTAEEYGDIYLDASPEDKETIDKIRSVSEFSLGAAGFSISVFILALAFLTEGTTRAKTAILSGVIMVLWGLLNSLAWSLQGFGFVLEFVVFFAILCAPMFAGGFLHLND